jgi:predicted porin
LPIDTLIALAAVAVSSAAFAQVSLTGRIDLGHANVKTTNLENNSDSKVTSLAGDQQGRTTSRLTFSGAEDLGGGLTARFNYETRLTPDNTATAGMDRTRNMFLNLSGGFGSVTIGTFLNAIDSVRGFSAATYSAPGGDFLANHQNLYGNTTLVTDADLNEAFGIPAATSATNLRTLARTAMTNGLSGRSTNAVAYASPSFGGVTFGLGLSNEKTAGSNTSVNKVDGMIGTVAYAAGPLNARLAFGQGKGDIKGSGSDLTSSKTTDTAFAVSYNLGVAVPYLIHETTKVTLSNFIGDATPGVSLKTKATELGATFPMGAATPYVTFSNGKIEDTKTSAFQLGSTYNLSKRTYLYGAVGEFKIEDIQKTTGYKLGLVHSF